MKLSQAIEGFLLSRLADGFAPVTLRGYKSALYTLAEYLQDPELTTITTEHLKGFMGYLHHCPATVVLHSCGIKEFGC